MADNTFWYRDELFYITAPVVAIMSTKVRRYVSHFFTIVAFHTSTSRKYQHYSGNWHYSAYRLFTILPY